MIFGNNRDELRQMYVDAWRKRESGVLLTPLEAQIAGVIEEHPEYHELIQRGETNVDFAGDGGQSNPFLHMGMHLAIREQVSTNRPIGISAIHLALCKKSGDQHDAEHQMIECLAETLWEAQRLAQSPDEVQYLERLNRLGRFGR